MKLAMYAAAMRQWGRISPKCLDEDYPSPAGSEIAMMSVARAFAARGHQVQVFMDVEPGTYDGVDYFRTDLALPLLTQSDTDVVVSWQDASIFQYPLKTKFKVLMCQGAHLGVGMADEQVDAYFAISHFSAEVLLNSDSYAKPEKMLITRNGVNLKRFGWTKVDGQWCAPEQQQHNPKHLVWASSPDRGLHHLVDIFKLVRAKVPDAKLTICYDFDKAYANYQNMLPGSVFVRWLTKAAELKTAEGVEVVQHISQPALAKLYAEAGILAYPCDPVRETETYCVTVNEAMAAGVPVLISDADCLPEHYGEAADVLSRPIDPEEWAMRIVQLMLDPELYVLASSESLALAKHTDYSGIAEDWETFFGSRFQGFTTSVDKSLAAKLGE